MSYPVNNGTEGEAEDGVAETVGDEDVTYIFHSKCAGPVTLKIFFPICSFD